MRVGACDMRMNACGICLVQQMCVSHWLGLLELNADSQAVDPPASVQYVQYSSIWGQTLLLPTFLANTDSQAAGHPTSMHTLNHTSELYGWTALVFSPPIAGSKADSSAKKFAVILAFDVPVSKEAREMADELNVKIFTADIIYHLFDQFTVREPCVVSEEL